MAETNNTAPSFWSKIGSVLGDKAIDLADSWAASKVGKETAKLNATGQPPVTAPGTAPTAPATTAANNQKLFLWIGGGVALLLIVVLLFRRR